MDVIKNPYLIAFNQDPVFGAGAAPYKWGKNADWTWDASNPAEYWSGQFSNGTMVLALNPEAAVSTRNINFAEIPSLAAGGSYQVTDAWTGSSVGCIKGGWNVTISSHDTAVFVVGDSC